MEDAGPLRLVNPATGEIMPDGCPNCETLGYQLDELTRKYHGALAQIGRLRADRARDAKTSRFWGIAVALFLDWRVATGRIRSVWSAERFWLCEPFLEADGYGTCRYAVWGLAASPMTKQVTADYQEVYDDWELAFRDRARFERYANRGFAIFGEDLPLGDQDAILRVHRRRAGVTGRMV